MLSSSKLSLTDQPSPLPVLPIYSADQVAKRMKQEGGVVRRVEELTRGLWPAKRMSKVAAVRSGCGRKQLVGNTSSGWSRAVWMTRRLARLIDS